MTKSLLATAALSSALTALLPAHATISVTGPGFSYAENFDTLAGSGTANAWANDGTLAGWSLFNALNSAPPTYVADNGASNTGAFRSFGDTGSTERAFGNVASGGAYFGSPGTNAVAGWMVLALTNTSGATLDNFTLAYNGEQWRNGGNTAVQSLTLEYGIGSSYFAVAGWVAPGGSFDFSSPVVGATAAAVAGNSAGLVTGLGGSVSGLNWAAGDTLFIRWADRNDSGNDHGLGIDDLRFSVSAVPEPGTWALMLAGVGAVGFLLRRRG